ncbi:MAG TPA: thioredoxin [Anaerolineae bacterium]|nr:thioredoxin [Anaerolineae bacterium]
MAGILKSLFGKKEEAVGVTAGVTEPTVAKAGTAAAVAEVAPTPLSSNAEPVHVTDDTFEEMVLNAQVPAMVDFWAPWCGPCRMVAPIVEDLAKEYDGRALIAKINTDENVMVAGQLGIMGIPTMILFKNGQEVDRVVGFAPRNALEEKLQAVLD